MSIDNNKISKKYVHEEFLELFNAEARGEYECLSHYSGMHGTINVRHLDKKCKHPIFLTTPSRFIHQKSKCPSCYSRNILTRTTEEFESKLQERMGKQYAVEGIYQGALKPIKIRHYVSESESHVFDTTPQRIYNLKQGCSYCFGRMTAEKYAKKVKERFGNEYTLLSDWKGSNEDITFRHESQECNFSISTRRAADFLHASNPRTCRACVKKKKKSLA